MGKIGINELKKNKYILVILIWVFLILISIQARSLLTEGVESSEEFTGDDTESYVGSELIKERFNISGDQVSHTVILSLRPLADTQDITSSKWRNLTLYLTMFLNKSIFNLEYDQIFSEPLLIMAGQTDFASSMVSANKQNGMISIMSSTLSLEGGGIEDFADHVETIRHLLMDIDAFYEFTESILGPAMALFMPSKEDAKAIDYILTGTVANFVDTMEVAETTFENSELIAVLVIIIILAFVFKSPMGIFLPLISMVAALFPTYLITYLLGQTGLFAINDFLPSIIAMIGIAVAVDYNLFSMVRFREEYRKRKAEYELNDNWTKENRKLAQVESAKVMNATAGNAVMFSGFTVITGFGAMLVLGSEFTLGMAIGVSTVVSFSILTARTLTPAILSLFGEGLDWPNFMSGARRDINAQKENRIKESVWVRWSKMVMKYPWVFLVIGIITITPFIVLSSQADLGFNMVKNLPKGTEAREGFEILFDEFNLGALTPYSIVIDGKTANSIFNSDLIDSVNDFGNWSMNFSKKRRGDLLKFETISTLSMISNHDSNPAPTIFNLTEVQGILNSPGNATENPLKYQFIGNSEKYINYEFGNNTLIIELTSNLDPGAPAAFDLVKVLRQKVSEHFSGFDVYVTGFSAAFTDSMDELYADVPKMLAVAVVLIFIALLIIFRSIILPIKAIITIGGSILFAIGALVYIFQDGHIQNIELLGVTLWEAEQSGIVFIIPVFLFTTILGLGMDYSIFIISRIREEYEKSGDMDEAVGIGLAKTAGVITSAATIMVATFMVFAMSPMVILKTMGFAMAIAIVVDASISRIIILPAAMKLLGDWNWWLPNWLKKILPEIKLEH